MESSCMANRLYIPFGAEVANHLISNRLCPNRQSRWGRMNDWLIQHMRYTYDADARAYLEPEQKISSKLNYYSLKSNWHKKINTFQPS